ncbi:MAG: PAS domain S-box protein [Candidatus Promineofilum sp.]|nr:PAS domain S-box protein [Promineifilum sp.]
MPNEDMEQPYRRLFEAAADGLILQDLETGLVVEANPAAYVLYGYAREEFIGLHPRAFMPSDGDAHFDEWAKTVQAGNVVEATVVHVRRDGTPFTAEIHGTSCLYRDRPCLLSVVRDVSAWVQVYEQARTLATLEERRRLARNLHDAVNQSLFSASLIAEVLPRLWEQHPAEVQAALEDLRRLTRGALAEMRGLLVELQPLELSDSELEDLVHLLGDAFTGRTNIPVTVAVTGHDALPSEVQIILYRLCQEALNNIAKHSGAEQVLIHLQYDHGTVALSIRDDGRGFDPGQVPPGHYGLNIMQERATAAGAALTIWSEPGQGTEVAVRWPAALEQQT